MAKKILILGAGFGGLETATGLAAALRGSAGYELTLIDKSDSFFVGFSKIDVLFGKRTEAQARYPYAKLGAKGVRFVQSPVTELDTDGRQVTTGAGTFAYDYLVIALGADLDRDATPGFRQSGAHDFYSMEGANRLRPVLESFSSGNLVLGILGTPYKCPPAPYEVACQLHERFVQKGIRDRINLTMVIPGARPVPMPNVSDLLEKMLAERKISLVRGTPISSIDAANKQVVVADKRVDYDLFVGVPLHVPPAVVRSSKLGKGFIPVNPATLETLVPNVYAIGDVAKIPVGAEMAVPKSGAFAEDAAMTVVSEILSKEGLGAAAKFRAKGSCYLELGGKLVARVDSDFLGGPQQQTSVEGPSVDLYADKLAFETTRRDRWFTP